jgi:hypothetical protein
MKLPFCLGDFCEISKYDNEDKFTVAQYNVRKVLQAATSSSLPAGKHSRDCKTDRVCEQSGWLCVFKSSPACNGHFPVFNSLIFVTTKNDEAMKTTKKQVYWWTKPRRYLRFGNRNKSILWQHVCRDIRIRVCLTDLIGSWEGSRSMEWWLLMVLNWLLLH